MPKIETDVAALAVVVLDAVVVEEAVVAVVSVDVEFADADVEYAANAVYDVVGGCVVANVVCL